MTYEQWLEAYGAPAPEWLQTLMAVLLVGLPLLVGLYVLVRVLTRKPNGTTPPLGGRILMACFAAPLAAVLTGILVLGGAFVYDFTLGPKGQLSREYPEHAGRYQREQAAAVEDRAGASREAQREQATEDWMQCTYRCDNPPECQGLAPLDGPGQTQCTRARRSCEAECRERHLSD